MKEVVVAWFWMASVVGMMLAFGIAGVIGFMRGGGDAKDAPRSPS